MCGCNTLTLALVQRSFLLFTTVLSLYLLNFHFLFVKNKKKLTNPLQVDQIPLEIAAFLIKDEVVKIEHSELVTAV